MNLYDEVVAKGYKHGPNYVRVIKNLSIDLTKYEILEVGRTADSSHEYLFNYRTGEWRSIISPLEVFSGCSVIRKKLCTKK